MTTITGTILDADGTAFEGNVTFEPLTRTRSISGKIVRIKAVVVETNASGALEVELYAGAYRVHLPAETIIIIVPGDDETYDMADLLDGSSIISGAITGANFRLRTVDGSYVLEIKNKTTGEWFQPVCFTGDGDVEGITVEQGS